MGKLYNTGWSVADTNRLASIVRRMDITYPIDKVNLHDFVMWVILNRRYRTVKLMSGFPYADNQMKEIENFVRGKSVSIMSRRMNINELTDDEWDFICELPVKEN